MLDVRGLEVRYGHVHALKGIDLEVREGEIVALVGANGAGKTTLLKALAGLLPYRGAVRYDGETLEATVPSDRRVGRGLVLVPEGRAVFGQMSVHENLVMGAYSRRRRADLDAELSGILARFPRLAARANVRAAFLSGGEQQMVAIGRALMARPRLLMLDEPSLGLAPLVVREVFDIVQELRASGITILLVEQRARQTLQIADRAYVLETGRVVAEGKAAELAESAAVRKAFLGGGH